MLRVLMVLSCSLMCYIKCEVLQQYLKEEHITLPPPSRPYAFGYAAGRYRGQIDRTHSEVSNGDGIVQGSYSYVDPRHEIRTVDYIADKNGFHVHLNKEPPALPSDTKVVADAKNRHLYQYAAIAQAHQTSPHLVVVPVESLAVQQARNSHLKQYAAIANARHANPGLVVVPIDTAAVQYATAKHLNLFEKIAQEHAQIAAERGEILDENQYLH